MTLDDMIRRFRTEAGDKSGYVLWSDEEITDFLDDGQVQACIRARLLREETLPSMCVIALSPGTKTYALHPKLYEIISLRLSPGNGDRARPIVLKSREWLNAEFPDWRDTTRPACFAIQDEASLRVVGVIEPGDRLLLEAYRLPLKSLGDTGKPEIHEAGHVALVQWALHRAFSTPDADMFDGKRAAVAETNFTNYFGPPVDSDLRRSTRSDVTHHTTVYLA